MQRIENIGNLPKHMQAFARQVGGQLSSAAATEFYEMSSVEEFEKKASEVGYEIIPTVDTSTGRGFLVGFDVTEPQRIATLVDYCTLKIYFRECSDSDLNQWVEKMKKHRAEQQAEMFRRREVLTLNREARRKLAKKAKNIKFRGGSDD